MEIGQAGAEFEGAWPHEGQVGQNETQVEQGGEPGVRMNSSCVQTIYFVLEGFIFSSSTPTELLTSGSRTGRSVERRGRT